ncbi:hypothetical protein [Nocardia sp. NPDC050175]|uniref:hypothetical protein n=1 Tax=Nocardia sp. NPDC050175 TaxID=3364317 RepID=UPI0037B5F885
MTLNIVTGGPIPGVLMGIDKNNSTLVADAKKTTAVVGWVVRPGYPGTVLDNNALVIDIAASGVVRAQVTLTGGWQTSSSLWAQLVRNGTEVASAEFAQGQAVGTIAQQTITVAPGDRLALNMVNSHFLYAATVQSGPGTYLVFEPAS